MSGQQREAESRRIPRSRFFGERDQHLSLTLYDARQLAARHRFFSVSRVKLTRVIGSHPLVKVFLNDLVFLFGIDVDCTGPIVADHESEPTIHQLPNSPFVRLDRDTVSNPVRKSLPAPAIREPCGMHNKVEKTDCYTSLAKQELAYQSDHVAELTHVAVVIHILNVVAIQDAAGFGEMEVVLFHSAISHIEIRDIQAASSGTVDREAL